MKPAVGFTLVELLIVVSIIAALSGFLIPNLNSYLKRQNIKQGQAQVITDLRQAQIQALTGVGHFNDETYRVVKFYPNNARYDFGVTSSTNLNSACNSLVVESKSESLPGDVVIRNPSTFCVFFSFSDGNAAFSHGQNHIKVGNLGVSGQNCLRININSAGYISEQTGFVSC